MQSTRNDILGWGADLRPEDRPGVPQELEPPHPIGSPTWSAPVRQMVGSPTAHDAFRPITPVYGTAVPLRGLSGLMRGAAYRIPDYRPSRWLLLMMADRVDVLEHSLAPIAIGVGLLGFAAYRTFRPKRRNLLARLGF